MRRRIKEALPLGDVAPRQLVIDRYYVCDITLDAKVRQWENNHNEILMD